MSVFMSVGKKLAEGAQTRFYSQAVRASEGLQRKTGNAAGFKNDLTGKGQVKPDELKAMGFDEHFGDRKDITKEEVQQFINENQVQIKETVLGDAPNLSDAQLAEWANQNFHKGHEDFIAAQTPRERKKALAHIEDIYKQEAVADSKFGGHTLEGGDNYRELLLQDDSSAGLLDELNSLNNQMGEIKTPLLRNVTSDDALKKRYSDATIFGDMEIDEFVANEIPEYAALLSRRDELVRQKDNLPEPFINSSHFDEPNILAHLRMKDRVDADGNKTLLIEEAQSDWHQTGADRGYVNNAEYADLVSEEQRLNLILDETSIDAGFNWGQLNAPDLSSAVESARIAFRAARQKAEDFPLLDHSEEIGATRDSLRAAKIELDDAFQQDYLKQNGVSPGAAHEQAQSEMQMLRAELDPMHDGVPDAPFKTDDKSSWYNLAMKRGLIEAAEGDYNKLAITTGRQQADRYDLSKQINEVRLGGNDQDGFTVSAFDKNDTPVIMQSIDSLDELPNLIGKDAAKSLVDQPLTDTVSGSARVLAGQDLSVGGEGMKEFYDRKLPNTLNKLVKQDGVKVGQSDLLRQTPLSESTRKYMEADGWYTPNDKATVPKDTVHSIDITPEMRERVKKGLPLFAQGGAVVGAGALFSPDKAQAGASAEQQKFESLEAEEQKLRAMRSSSFGKVSSELAAYRRSQLLPSIGTLAQGAVRDTAKGLDYLSGANLTRLLLDPADEGLSRFFAKPISDKISQGAKVVTQPMLFDEDDPYSKKRKQDGMDLGGMLFSPL